MILRENFTPDRQSIESKEAYSTEHFERGEEAEHITTLVKY